MSLKEKHLRGISNFPQIDMDVESLEDSGEYIEEWISEDKTRKIVVTVMGGGPEWDGIWLKDIRLLTLNDLLACELMRVQIVKNEELQHVVKNIYMDVFSYEGNVGKMESYSFSSDNAGTREQAGHIRLADRAVSPLDYIEALTNSEVNFINDLPEAIDVDETIRLFVEQLQELRFTRPVLVCA